MTKRKIQRTSNEGCWQFLDCEMLTGIPADKCPNAKSCKQNALLSQNRWCFLPYQMWLPEYDQLYKIPTLEVDCWVAPEAREAGYSRPVSLFYAYEDSFLGIGEDKQGKRICDPPPEAKELGFAMARYLPYKFLKGVLTVEIINDHRILRDMGWGEAVEMPYRLHHDMDTGKKFIKVQFDINHTKNQEAIAAGWHPGYRLCKI